MEVVRRLNEAVTSGQGFSAAGEFAAACKQSEEKDKGGEASMGSTWQLLLDIMTPAVSKGLSNASGAKFTEALVAGGQAGRLGAGRAAGCRHGCGVQAHLNSWLGRDAACGTTFPSSCALIIYRALSQPTLTDAAG
jgi:hypothetical protein